MNKSIILNGREISYELERKSVKNINLRIRADCSVYVSASARVADSVIEGFLQKKADYILSALDKYAEIARSAPPARNYVTGESFYYLGKELRLVVTQGKSNVSLDGVCLTVSVPDICDNALKEKLINKWYDAQCAEVFDEIISEIYPIFRKHLAMPRVTLRNMSSRWGSCRMKRGAITLNKRLIETPLEAVEYVVMHEFVHFLHPNHSSKFYDTLSSLMPDWKVRKKLLESAVLNRPLKT